MLNSDTGALDRPERRDGASVPSPGLLPAVSYLMTGAETLIDLLLPTAVATEFTIG
jgi:hypothetical protein